MKQTFARASLLLAAAALATSAFVATPVGAATAQQTCKKMTGTAVLTPGLTTTPHKQTANATSTVTGCTPAAKTGGSGHLTARLNLPANSSCQGLATGNQTIKIPSAKITWKNHKTSTMALTAKTGTGSKATVATITGKVTLGLFKGHSVTTALSFAPKSGENCTPGHPIRHLTLKNTKPFVIH
jgi:hypothetical protein